MNKILFTLILICGLFAQDNCSEKIVYDCDYVANDHYLYQLLLWEDPDQRAADFLLQLYGTPVNCKQKIVEMSDNEKKNCKEIEEWDRKNTRTASTAEEAGLQEEIQIEANRDMIINNETFETIYYVQNGRVKEHRRYNKNNEYVGRYHYQYYGDAFGTERDSKILTADKDEIRDGRTLWWYPSRHIESEQFFENGKSVSKKCFADSPSNKVIPCP
jgi:hypothetical protein